MKLAWSVLLLTSTTFRLAPLAVGQSADTTSSPASEMHIERIESEESTDHVAWLREHPLHLNIVSAAELLSIPGVTEAEARLIVAYRDAAGTFTSVEELARIDDYLYRKVRDFVAAYPPRARDEPERTKGSVFELRLRTVRRSPLSDDLKVGLGSASKEYVRMIAWPVRRFQVGALFEKDSGERRRDGFISGYAAVEDIGPLRMAIVGDYGISLGQGLLFGRGGVLGFSEEPGRASAIAGDLLHPHRSTNESSYLRGFAATVGLAIPGGVASGSLFWSRRALDGAITADGTVSSLYSAGLFRTPSELKKRGTIHENLVGIRVEFRYGKSLSLGGIWCRMGVDRDVRGREWSIPGGTTMQVAGFDWSADFGRGTFTGEFARGLLAAGASISLTRKLELGLKLHDLGGHIPAHHASPSTSSGEGRGERGAWLGFKASISPWLILSAGIGAARGVLPSYGAVAPGTAVVFGAESEWRLSQNFTVFARGTLRVREAGGSSSDVLGRETRTMQERRIKSLRVSSFLNVSRSLRLRSRGEILWSDAPDAEGLGSGAILYHDIRWIPTPRIRIQVRLVLFAACCFETRIVEFEDEVPGAYQAPALFGSGRRWYVIVSWMPVSILRFTVKFSRTQLLWKPRYDDTVAEGTWPEDRSAALQVDFGI